ncbi:M16 family metallopeptidase, partial [Pedobacter sp.]|uniref:M16 family metallopeptidase n=1 Tax=Pedobacter sp. TaxID=1411316 RepID=UPI003C6929EE
MNNQFRQYNRIAIITVLALLEFLISSAQTIPLDPALKIGKLPNGFTYYIRRNTMPAKMAQLYLVNKFGSLVEDDDQQGLAHFMEHMNFNGTKNFPKNELIEYLQKSGVRFGADVNAHTGFEETVYELPLPSDDPQLLRNGIGIMRDWAQEALLEPVEIDKERGVILEEARLRKGTSERMSKTYMPMLLNHSRYTSRFPIGLEEILKTFPPKAIARFKKDWYRPDLQALIVVGDVDTAHIEKLIIEKFSDLSTVANARKCIPYEIPLTGGNQFLLVTDKEMLGTTIEILYKHRQPELKTQADYRRSIVQSLYGLLVNFRKQSEISKEKDPAFTDISLGMQALPGKLEMFVFEVSPKQGRLKPAFMQAFGYLEKIKRYGFTPRELIEAKNNLLKRYTASLSEKN